MAVSYLDRQVFSILAPTITRELAIDDQTFGWLAATFSAAYLIGPPFAALLLDKVGVRKGLMLAVLAWSLVAALHASALGVATLFALRFALGLAEAPAFPGAARVVREASTPESSSRAFGFLFTGSSLGAIVAPPLAAAIAAHLGWRFAFVGTAVVGLSWIPIWWWVSSRGPSRTLLDSAQTTAVHARSPANDHFPAGVWNALRVGATWRAIIAIVASAPVAAFVLLWGAKLLVGRFAVAQRDVGHYLWLPPLLFDLGAVAFGDMATRIRRRAPAGGAEPIRLRVLFGCTAALTTSIAWVSFTTSVPIAMLFAGIAMMGVGGAFAILTSVLLTHVRRDLVTVCAGLSAASQSLAYLIASPMIGRVVSHSGYGPALIGLALWAIPGAIAWVAWPSRPPPLDPLPA